MLSTARRSGTRFPALATRLESRKRWLLAGPKPAGQADHRRGAVKALSVDGRSLLPAGITRVEGAFHRGDTVIILTPQGHELARGLVAYNSEDLLRLLGCHTDDIEPRLGLHLRPDRGPPQPHDHAE